MGRNEEFGYGGQRPPAGWVKVRANTVSSRATPLVAIPHADGHLVGRVVDHEQPYRSHPERHFAVKTDAGETHIITVPSRSWLLYRRDQG